MNAVRKYDRIIIGAGLYGLYAARLCGRKGLSVLVLEKEDAPFMKATFINQARVHMGYHYPRSLSTAMKTASYFRRFSEDYRFCINDDFKQIYATSSEFSWTNAEQFKDFCKAAEIKCEEVPANRWFNEKTVDGAFLTEEYTYDANKLRDFFLDEINGIANVEIRYGVHIQEIGRQADEYLLATYENNQSYLYASGFVLNATYASVNQILQKVHPGELFDIKYELCEVILCDVDSRLKEYGITVMDGPFFSIMPFGYTGMHSLTSVTFTPHVTSYDRFPAFGCQMKEKGKNADICSQYDLGNCNTCPNKPESSWEYMRHLAGKYLKAEYEFSYNKSLFSMKPILKSCEIDDSRPVSIKVHSEKPVFISVLSGKINTVYDLDEYLV